MITWKQSHRIHNIIAVGGQHVTSLGHVYFIRRTQNNRLGRHARLQLIGIYYLRSSGNDSTNRHFLGLGAGVPVGVPFEFAVVLGVAVLGEVGVGVVLVGVLVWLFELLDACIMCIASVSRNAGDFTEANKPAARVSRWRQRGSWFLV
jgi:uncharacterized membrane protein YphA (DoxX/SURF4 family)